MYYGDEHTTNITLLLIHLFPSIQLSPLYTNNDKQCIVIPMKDGVLSFANDLDKERPFKYGYKAEPTKKATHKEDEPYPSIQLQELRRGVEQKRMSQAVVPLPHENRMYHIKKQGKRTRKKSRRFRG